MITGLNAIMIPKYREKEVSARIKRFLCKIESITNEEEFDAKDEVEKTIRDMRILRISKIYDTHP